MYFKFLLLALICASSISNAQYILPYDWSFRAPSLNDHTTIDPKTSGDIVFDTSDDNFYGWNGSTWIQFGGSSSFTSPSVQKFTSGSGTYTTPAGVLYLKVTVVGAGGGTGVGSNGNGGNSTFGSSLITANGGNAGTTVGSGAGGTGGTTTVAGGPIVLVSLSGGNGQGGGTATTNVDMAGSNGGGTILGSGGAGGAPGSVANSAGRANTGEGAGMMGCSGSGSGCRSGAGGGGSVVAIINSPSATYSYSVGAAGAAGTSGAAGGSGVIIVEEYYQ